VAIIQVYRPGDSSAVGGPAEESVVVPRPGEHAAEIVGVPERATNGPSVVGREATVGASLEALAASVERLERLTTHARCLDALAVALPGQQAKLERQRRELKQAAHANAVEASRLRELESALESERAAVQMRSELLARREAVLEEERQNLSEQARVLEERAGRFRWRWLVWAWRWRPPLPSQKARTCELLFVPASEGYKLLEQEGVALAPDAQVSGLLDERRTFTVMKIAQLPFDGRWCAYLQENQVMLSQEEL
jgi:hypothetical protein